MNHQSIVLGLEHELVVLYLFILKLTAVPLSIFIIGLTLYFSPHTLFSASGSYAGFVPGPTSRGTLDLIWTCLSTIFICAYVAAHIDVTDKDKLRLLSSEIQSKYAHRGFFVRCLVRLLVWVSDWTKKTFVRRLLWVLFLVFAPEAVVFVAAIERLGARAGLKAMQCRGQEGWSLKLAFFADMGGLGLERGMPYDGYELLQETHFSNGHQFLRWFDKLWKDRKVDFRIDVEQLEREIDERCKLDVVVKIFTGYQAVWFFVQCFVRLAQGLTLSELEVMTCTYIVNALFIYACWLHKPSAVDGRILLRKEMFIPCPSALHHSSSPQLTTLSTILTEPPAFEGNSPSIPLLLPTPLDPTGLFTPLNRSFTSHTHTKTWLRKYPPLPHIQRPSNTP